MDIGDFKNYLGILGRPENYLFLLPKNVFIGSKYPKDIYFNPEKKNFTDGRHGPVRGALPAVPRPPPIEAAAQR